MKKRITFVGLDTHKNSIEVALADEGANSEVRLYGSIGGDLDSLDKMIRKLRIPGPEPLFRYSHHMPYSCQSCPSASRR